MQSFFLSADGWNDQADWTRHHQSWQPEAHNKGQLRPADQSSIALLNDRDEDLIKLAAVRSKCYRDMEVPMVVDANDNVNLIA